MVENNKNLKYRYFLHTWGGFYDKNRYNHKYINDEGDHWFDTKEERKAYIEDCLKVSKETGACMFASSLAEGYHLTPDIPQQVIHRVVEHIPTGKRYYSKSEQIHRDHDFDALTYWKNYKWYPGFNDWVALNAHSNDEKHIQDIMDNNMDWEEYEKYVQENFKVIQEWVTGSIQITDN